MTQKLTASIVLFNTPRTQIENVLKSVFDSACVETLYLIDNSPNDKWRILEKRSQENGVTKLRYIHNENLGYGASHNLAMSEAIENGSVYHVVLNPDIRFGAEVLPALVDFMRENPDALRSSESCVSEWRNPIFVQTASDSERFDFPSFSAKNKMERKEERPLLPEKLWLRQGYKSAVP